MTLNANILLLKIFNPIHKLDLEKKEGGHPPFSFFFFFLLNGEWGMENSRMKGIGKRKITFNFSSTIYISKESFNSVESSHTQTSLHHFAFSSNRSVSHCRSNTQHGDSF